MNPFTTTQIAIICVCLLSILLFFRNKIILEEKTLRSLITSTGGRRFIITMLGMFSALVGAANNWITSQSYENVTIWLAGFFVTGNTIEQFKPQTGGIFDKVSTMMAQTKLGGTSTPTPPSTTDDNGTT